MSPAVVLNTRPREQSDELTRLLNDAGFDVVEAPAIAIMPAWDPAELKVVREDLRGGNYAWVVLPSRNAGVGLDLSEARVVCGAGTASALGLNAAIALQRFSAAAALEALRGRVAPGERVLVPRAAEGRDELVAGLLEIGASVHSPVAYRTVTVDDAATRLAAGGIDVVTLSSPSAATSLAAAVSSELVVCLGDTTAAAARATGMSVAAVAANTSMASMVAAVESVTRVRV